MLEPVFDHPNAIFRPKSISGFGRPVVTFRGTRSNRRLVLFGNVTNLDSRGLARNRAWVFPVAWLGLDNPSKVKRLPPARVSSHSLTGKQKHYLFLVKSHPCHVAAFVPRVPVNRSRSTLTRFRLRVLLYFFASLSPGLAQSIKNTHTSKITRKRGRK